MGRLIEAREQAIGVEHSAPIPGEREAYAEARNAAKELEIELETRIPSIKVSLVGGAADVTVDGAKLPAALINMTRKINPGKHTIKANDKTIEIELFEREAKEVPIEVGTASPPQPLDIKPAPPPAAHGAKRSPVPLVLLISGGVITVGGAVVGRITGAMSMSQTSTIKNECGMLCPPSRKSELDNANTLATISTISFIAAGAGAVVLGVGAFLFATGKPAQAGRVRPFIGVAAAGIQGEF